MDTEPDAAPMSIGQLGHHIGLHVSVNLQGKTVGGVLISDDEWVTGVIIGMGALGDSLTIKLDAAIGGGESGGLFHHESHGQDTVSVDDPARVRPQELSGGQAPAASDAIADLVHAGKTMEAIKQYRALNGATLDEARAHIATL
jgi:hypothetical protein